MTKEIQLQRLRLHWTIPWLLSHSCTIAHNFVAFQIQDYLKYYRWKLYHNSITYEVTVPIFSSHCTYVKLLHFNEWQISVVYTLQLETSLKTHVSLHEAHLFSFSKNCLASIFCSVPCWVLRLCFWTPDKSTIYSAEIMKKDKSVSKS